MAVIGNQKDTPSRLWMDEEMAEEKKIVKIKFLLQEHLKYISHLPT
jgi:hypothetical protein